MTQNIDIKYKKYLKDLKETAALTIVAGLLIVGNYFVFEPEMIKGAADTIVVTQQVIAETAISAPADVNMSGSIAGVTGNLGAPTTGSAAWTVTSNNSLGFQMALKASTNPAMRLDATYNFSDYSPAVAGTPDYTWASPASSAAEFGYTVEPATAADTAAKFRDNGIDTCNIGASNTANKCWYNMSTVDETVINRSSNTSSGGEAETVRFQAESNAKYLASGNYAATITATVTNN